MISPDRAARVPGASRTILSNRVLPFSRWSFPEIVKGFSSSPGSPSKEATAPRFGPLARISASTNGSPLPSCLASRSRSANRPPAEASRVACNWSGPALSWLLSWNSPRATSGNPSDRVIASRSCPENWISSLTSLRSLRSPAPALTPSRAELKSICRVVFICLPLTRVATVPRSPVRTHGRLESIPLAAISSAPSSLSLIDNVPMTIGTSFSRLGPRKSRLIWVASR